MIKWIHDVCKLCEIDEDEVSMLKTLSGAGLNELSRNDWIKRSPNQGDMFFTLWSKLMKNSQEGTREPADDKKKSPPASPRKGMFFKLRLFLFCAIVHCRTNSLRSINLIKRKVSSSIFFSFLDPILQCFYVRIKILNINLSAQLSAEV